MKKLLLPILVLFLTAFSSFGQSNVTFSVDMSQYTGSTANGVFVNGSFNGWCGSCNPMSDADGNGIWEVTLPLANGMIEYKFTVDGWNAQENFTPGMPCVLTTGPYTNRVTTISGNTALPTVCWNSCAACSVVTTSNVTFAVNMSQYGGSTANGVYLNGTFNGWCGSCNPMSDADGDGTWEVTLPLNNGIIEYKFTVDGWNDQENFTPGTSCTVTNNGFTNRALNIAGNVSVPPVCWNSCANCGVSTTSDVTFSVDMSAYTGSTANGVFLNGSFNGWCGSCNPMSDPDGDGIWETTVNIQNSTIEYKFTVDGWNDQENLTPGMPCVLTTGAFTNRVLSVTGNASVPTVCWNSCTNCAQIACPVLWTSLTGLTQAGSTFTKTNGISGWSAGARSINVLAAGQDGWVSTEVIQTDKRRMFGLSALSAAKTNKITYGVYLERDGTLSVFENKVNKGSFGTYSVGDVFKVRRTGTVVDYLKNDVVFYTSLVASKKDLYAGFSIHGSNGNIHNALTSFDCSANICSIFSANIVSVTDESCAGANDGSVVLSASNTNVRYQWPAGYSSNMATRSGLAPGTYGVVVVDTLTNCTAILQVTIAAGGLCYPDFCPVNWTNLSGVSLTGTTVTKTNTTNSWNAGALGSNMLSAGQSGWVEMEVLETNRRRAFGLHSSNTSTNQNLRYAIHLASNGVFQVMENGTLQGTSGTYVAGDKFRVVRTGNVVTYLRNGSLFHTSTVASTTDLYPDFSIFNAGGTIHNALASFGCAPISSSSRVVNPNQPIGFITERTELQHFDDVKVYPNPAFETMTVDINIQKSANLNITILDLTGRTLETQNFENQEGTTQLNFNVSNLADGVYFLRIQAEGQVVTKRFVVAK